MQILYQNIMLFYACFYKHGNKADIDYIFAPTGLCAIRKNGCEDKLHYVLNDNMGSVQVVTNQDGETVNEYYYTPWGGRRRIDDGAGKPEYPDLTDRGYTGHEHLTALGLINMNGRIYDPTLARFLAPDPYVQAPDFSQGFNRYAYCLNNPFKYTDPDGEIAWFVPMIIGAVAGAVNGAILAHQKAENIGQWFGYILGGAAIGAASGAVSFGLGAAGAPAWFAGGIGSGFSGTLFSGMATNWNGKAMLQGAGFGFLSSVAGGLTSTAIGGGWGAFVGGVVSSVTNTTLNGLANKNLNGWNVLISAGIGGVMAYGTYELTSYIGYATSGMKEAEIKYSHYKIMQSDFMKSRTFHKEYGGYLMKDGSVQRFGSEYRHNYAISNPEGNVPFELPEGGLAMYHTHWDKAGRIMQLNGFGERLRPGQLPYPFQTSRSHSDPVDFMSFDSYVIYRSETWFNPGGTNELCFYKDGMLKYYPMFNFYFMNKK